MADNNQHDKDNLIDLASERRKFQNRPIGPKKHQGVHKASKKKPVKVKAGPRWYHYLQLILFLAVLAWMMQKCQSGGF